MIAISEETVDDDILDTMIELARSNPEKYNLDGKFKKIVIGILKKAKRL